MRDARVPWRLGRAVEVSGLEQVDAFGFEFIDSAFEASPLVVLCAAQIVDALAERVEQEGGGGFGSRGSRVRISPSRWLFSA